MGQADGRLLAGLADTAPAPADLDPEHADRPPDRPVEALSRTGTTSMSAGALACADAP
ncbi:MULTISPECIES: hypothetical protein [unclassified Caulobacter]|uniref:hypothetical protein n=1 Tax=unclassified Caulobacter TaxID=2648921 RepID=UPI000AABA9FD|nr:MULTISPECIES: hypothetical protein [unclassified Caulobacter]